MALQFKIEIEPFCELALQIRGHPHLESHHWQCWADTFCFTLKGKFKRMHYDDCGTEEHLG